MTQVVTVSATTAAYAAEADPEKRLRAMARCYVDFARREPHAYRIMFEMNPLTGVERYPELVAQQMRGWEPLLRGVTAAVDAGLLAGEPAHLAHVFWAAVHGIASLHLAGTYTLLGSRPGYKDVRVELIVSPDSDAPRVFIACKEPV